MDFMPIMELTYAASHVGGVPASKMLLEIIHNDEWIFGFPNHHFEYPFTNFTKHHTKTDTLLVLEDMLSCPPVQNMTFSKNTAGKIHELFTWAEQLTDDNAPDPAFYSIFMNSLTSDINRVYCYYKKWVERAGFKWYDPKLISVALREAICIGVAPPFIRLI